jgi:hypothetical protein
MLFQTSVVGKKNLSSLALQVVFCIAVGAKGDEEVLALVLVQCFW